MKPNEKFIMRTQRGYSNPPRYEIETDAGVRIATIYGDEHLARLITLLPRVAQGLLDAGNLILVMAENFMLFDKYHRAMLENAGEIRRVIDLFKPEKLVDIIENPADNFEPCQDGVTTMVLPLEKKKS